MAGDPTLQEKFLTGDSKGLIIISTDTILFSISPTRVPSRDVSLSDLMINPYF
jgi:hypothetical protein